MTLFVNSLLVAWQRNGDYGVKLVADLSDAQMVFQPQPNMNHPAWIFSHLCAYHPVLVGLVQGTPVDDPKDHPFGMLSHPVADVAAYAPAKDLTAQFQSGHDQVADILRAASEADLSQPMSIPRWQTPFPKVGDCLCYLMAAHEAVHLGQISAWRRVQGLPPV